MCQLMLGSERHKIKRSGSPNLLARESHICIMTLREKSRGLEWYLNAEGPALKYKDEKR